MSVRADDLDPDTRAKLFALSGAPELKPTTKKSPDQRAELMFGQQLLIYRLPPFHHHYRFAQSLHPTNKRKVWIADYCSIEWKLMIEVDGGIWTGGAHGHPVDITRNMMKQNDAALLGFQTLRFATTWIKNKHAIDFLQRVLYAKGWRPHV